MHLSEFEKMLIARRLLKDGKGRDAAKYIVQTIKYAATPEGAAKLLKMYLLTDDAETVVELSRECEELWGQKQQIAVEGTRISGTKGAYLKQSGQSALPFEGKYFQRAANLLANARMEYGMHCADVAANNAIMTSFFVKFAPGEQKAGFIAGWASTADLDSYDHIVENGAFADAIRKRGLTGPNGIKLLLGHNWNQLAGVISTLEYRVGGLWIEAQLNLDIGYVKDAYLAAKAIGGTNFSVGFVPQDYSWKETKGGKEYLNITRGDLFEVSVVPFPGNEAATMEVIR